MVADLILSDFFMSSKPRNILSGNIYHVYNRAANSKTIFYTESDYNYFIDSFLNYQNRTGIKILAYSIMPNHLHFMLEEPMKRLEPKSKLAIRGMSVISEFMALLSDSYTKHFNLRKDHSGRIFQGPFKSKLVDSDTYLHTLIAYINLNPLKHKLVKNINEWPYTSHHDYLERASLKRIINEHYLIDFREYQEDIKMYIEKLLEINEEL